MEWQRRGLHSWYARNERGTALIHDLGPEALLDIWGPDQTTIGTGWLPTVDAAKERAESILDLRLTCWDKVGILLPDDP